MDDKEKLENYIQKIRIKFDSEPQLVLKELNNSFSRMNDKTINKNIIPDPDSKKLITYRIIIIVIIVCIGILARSNLFMYFFGSVFFFAGHFVALKNKGAGIIFLFSHCVTGMVIMIGSLMSATPFNNSDSINALLKISNVNSNIYGYVGTALLIMIIAIIYSIIYNLNDDLKNNKYNQLIPLALHMIGFLMIGICPYIINKL